MFKRFKNFFKNHKKWWLSLGVVILTPLILVSCGTQVNVAIDSKDNKPVIIQSINNNNDTIVNQRTIAAKASNSNDIVLSEDNLSIVYKGNVYKTDNTSIKSTNIYKPLLNKAIISTDEKSILLNGKTYKLVPKLKQKLDDATFELVKDKLIYIKTVQMFGDTSNPITIALYILFIVMLLSGILFLIIKLRFDY